MSGSKWDMQFSRHKHAYGKEPNEFIREHSNLFQHGAHIACFAEGEGRNAIYLAKQGYEVTTYDYSKVGLAHTEEYAKEENVTVETVYADLTKDEVPKNTYDGAIFVYGHVPKTDQMYFFDNVFSSVKQGGYIMFEVYSEEQLQYGTGGPKRRDMLYDPKDVLKWIELYNCKHFFYGERTRHEGTFHTGLGHVIQCIIQK